MNWGAFAVQAIREWAPFSEETRERRQTNKARRRKRKGKPLTPEQERLLEKHGQALPVETGGSMQGYKTYSGIVIALVGVVLGWLGVGEGEADTLATQIGGALDQVLTIGGLLFAAYGRAKAKPAA